MSAVIAYHFVGATLRDGRPIPADGEWLKGKRGEVQSFLREVVFSYDGDECLLWPFYRSRSGYAIASYGGKRRVVSRLLCELTHGLPPSASHEAAHSCGNGHRGCVTKRHLSWKTHSDNMGDMVAHGASAKGERHGNSKLAESDVLAIRSLGHSMTAACIAKQFGISRRNVSNILNGDSWSWLP